MAKYKRETLISEYDVNYPPQFTANGGQSGMIDFKDSITEIKYSYKIQSSDPPSRLFITVSGMDNTTTIKGKLYKLNTNSMLGLHTLLTSIDYEQDSAFDFIIGINQDFSQMQDVVLGDSLSITELINGNANIVTIVLDKLIFAYQI